MAVVRLQRSPSVPVVLGVAMRLLAILCALLVAALVLAAMGKNPITLAGQVFESTFGNEFGLEDAALLFSPLILTGLSVAIALEIGAWNIGAEGQFYLGAFAAAGIGLYVPGPGWLILPLMFVGGALAGAAWILVPTLARAFAGVSELITTLLLNFVATLLVYWVSTGPWLDPSGRALATTASIPHEVPMVWGEVHWGLPIGLLLALLFALLLGTTRWGYEVRFAGSNPQAARYAGMPVRRHLIGIMLLSGAIAGIAGMLELAGTVHRLQGGISNNYGYLGIVVAVLAQGSPVGVIAAAALMAVILNAGLILQTEGITSATVLAITGLILFFTAIGEELAHYRLVRTRRAPA